MFRYELIYYITLYFIIQCYIALHYIKALFCYLIFVEGFGTANPHDSESWVERFGDIKPYHIIPYYVVLYLIIPYTWVEIFGFMPHYVVCLNQVDKSTLI